MLEIIESKIVFPHSVRNLCIINNWYTMGNCNEYEELLRIAEESNGCKEDIIKMAINIINHTSDKEWEPGYSAEDIIEVVAFKIGNTCCMTTYKYNRD